MTIDIHVHVRYINEIILITGYKDLGEILLQKFKWGHSFYEVNQELLEKYARCKDSAEVVTAQKEYLEQLEVEHNKPKDGMMPRTHSFYLIINWIFYRVFKTLYAFKKQGKRIGR